MDEEQQDQWSVDVMTSPHDDVKRGILARQHSRVVVSRTEWPNPWVAQEVAAQLAVAVHGGMPTRVLIRV